MKVLSGRNMVKAIVALLVCCVLGCSGQETPAPPKDEQLEKLAKQLNSDDYQQRREVIFLLGDKYPGKRALQLMLDRLEREDNDVTLYCLVADAGSLAVRFGSEADRRRYTTAVMNLYDNDWAKRPDKAYDLISMAGCSLTIMKSTEATSIILEAVVKPDPICTDSQWLEEIEFLVHEKEEGVVGAFLLNRLEWFDICPELFEGEGDYVLNTSSEALYLACHKMGYESKFSFVPNEIKQLRYFSIRRSRILRAMVEYVEAISEDKGLTPTPGLKKKCEHARRIIKYISDDRELARTHKRMLEKAERKIQEALQAPKPKPGQS